MRITFFPLATLTFLAFHSAAVNAQQFECDTMYTTQEGDSLSRIAGRVYGRTTAYQPIFDFNPGKMTSPSQLPVGVDLYLPCIDSANAHDLPPIAPTTSAEIKIVTGSNYPPYVDAGLPNGGFSFELVERALQYGNSEANYKIDVIDDWSAHLTPLIEDGAYELGFPWYQPDCLNREVLGDHSTWRCDYLRFSEPLHEVVVTFYVRKEMASEINSAEDVHGMTLCRPRGYFTHDLESMGLMPPVVIRVAGSTPRDCFERLDSGEVDIVSVNADLSDNAITELGIRDRVAELINLATVQTLHVVGLRENPETRVNLLRINQGLIGLREDGRIRAIAATHLTTN